MTMRKTYKCACCGDPFKAREADRKRGWARYCSKSCKAIVQTRRTGRGKEGRSIYENEDGSFQMTAADLAMGGYGDATNETPFGDGKF